MKHTLSYLTFAVILLFIPPLIAQNQKQETQETQSSDSTTDEGNKPLSLEALKAKIKKNQQDSSVKAKTLQPDSPTSVPSLPPESNQNQPPPLGKALNYLKQVQQKAKSSDQQDEALPSPQDLKEALGQIRQLKDLDGNTENIFSRSLSLILNNSDIREQIQKLGSHPNIDSFVFCELLVIALRGLLYQKTLLEDIYGQRCGLSI